MHMIEVSYSWRAEKWDDCDESFLFMTRCRVHVGKDHLTLAPFIPRMARLDVCKYVKVHTYGYLSSKNGSSCSSNPHWKKSNYIWPSLFPA